MMGSCQGVRKNVVGKYPQTGRTAMFEGQQDPQKMGQWHERALRNEQRADFVNDCREICVLFKAEMWVHKDNCCRGH